MKLFETINRYKGQYLVHMILSITLLIFTAVLLKRNPQIFRKLLGEFPPILALSIVIALGFVMFTVIMDFTDLEFYTNGGHRLLYLSIIAAALLTLLIIFFVDLRGGYEEDINVLAPDGLLYYPVMGYLADIIFHIIPFSILLLLARFLLGADLTQDIPGWIFLIASLFEPLFQALIMQSTGWVQAYQFVHIFLINLIQFLLFREHDFISMYMLRIVYYLFWHLIWGYFRLEILF